MGLKKKVVQRGLTIRKIARKGVLSLDPWAY